MEQILSINRGQVLENLRIWEELDDIMHVTAPLALFDIALREFLSMQKESDEPEQFIAEIDSRSLNLAFLLALSN